MTYAPKLERLARKVGFAGYAAFLSSPEWRAMRQQRLELDCFRCTRCQSDVGLRVHHRWYPDDLRDVPMEALSTLCVECHRVEHGFSDEPSPFGKLLREQQGYRRIFVMAFGPWPHPCHFCKRPVDGHTRPFDSTAAVVHHLDGDDTNNEQANLAPAHNGCHVRYHKSGAVYTAEQRAKMSEGHKGNTSRRGHRATPETRAKLSASHMGKSLSPESRAKVSAAHKGRVNSPETRAKLRAANLGKKASSEARAAMSAAQARSPRRACCMICRREMSVTQISRHLPACRRKAAEAAAEAALTPAERYAKRWAGVKAFNATRKGKSLSPEHRAKIGAGNKERWDAMSPNARERRAAVSRAAIAAAQAANTGRSHSPEHRAKIRVSRAGYSHSAETRAKMRAAQKGRVVSPEKRAQISATVRGLPHASCVKCHGEFMIGSPLANHLRACLRS